MSRLIQRHYEKGLFVLALVMTMGSAFWFWRERTLIRSLQREPVQSVPTGPAWLAEKIPSPRPVTSLWAKPGTQSRGSGWLYEVFTPPAISYDSSTRTFAVRPPPAPTQRETAEAGLQLLTVKREPFRVQLAGYMGEPGDYVAAFASQLSPETWLARPGQRLESQGITLKSFALRPVVAVGGEIGRDSEVAAVAVLLDDWAGTEVVLDSRNRTLTDTLVAVFSPMNEKSGARELREGETWSGEVVSYRVKHIQLDPPEVILSRPASDQAEADTQVLHPVARVAAKESPAKLLPPQGATDVAAANP